MDPAAGLFSRSHSCSRQMFLRSGSSSLSKPCSAPGHAAHRARRHRRSSKPMAVAGPSAGELFALADAAAVGLGVGPVVGAGVLLAG